MFSILWRFRSVLRPYRGILALGGLLVLVVSALELALPWPLKIVVDNVLPRRPVGGLVGEIVGPLAGSTYGLLAACALALVALAGLAAVGSYLSSLLLQGVGERMVADLRAETPSAAMTRILPDQYALRQQFDLKIDLLTQQMRKRLQRVASKVDAIEKRPVFRKPLERFERMQQQLDQLRARLVRATQNHQETLKQQVGALAEQLEALSPLKVLARGYSLTQRADGLVVRDVAEVTVGEELTTRLSRGQLRVRVEGIESAG